MSETPLSNEEFAALVAIDGGLMQRRPSREMEAKLRKLGLVYLFRPSGMPVRTAEGEALVKAGLHQKSEPAPAG